MQVFGEGEERRRKEKEKERRGRQEGEGEERKAGGSGKGRLSPLSPPLIKMKIEKFEKHLFHFISICLKIET